MSDREQLIRSIGLAVTLALFASVITATGGSGSSVSVPGRLDRLRRDFATPPHHPKQLLAAASLDGSPQIRVLHAEEDDEEDKFAAAMAPARIVSSSPRPSSTGSASVPRDHRFTSRHYPLRS